MNGRAPSTSSFNYQWTYDVFINFRGEDTRLGFTGNLYKALCQKGIQTFIDDEELNKGEEITPTLLEKIEQSRMAIIVFSKDYASSTFCLDELVKILQSIKRKGRLVWPIFYDVEPSDVRHQKGKYAEALAMHINNFKANDEKVQNWKQALREAANISGLHFKLGHEYEHKFIHNIVKEISSKIGMTPLYIANHPVGLESRVLEIISLLEKGSPNIVDMIGISGIGGIGKTTIARALYNSIADQFEGLCFLHDIKENSSKLGLQQIQETMLSKILGVDIKVEDVNKGVPIIKRRLNQKRILLILDNVDKLEQLEKLAGGCDWFGSGSRIIITTRDTHLLERHGIERIHELEELDDKESLELFSWNAFKNNIFDPSYLEILNNVVQYAQGLPLALEVIGSHLFGKSVKEWHCALDGYRKVPSKDIQKILKVSYDGLEENEQKIFLDIASFFKGEHVTYVMNMVKYAHGFDPDYGIGVLKDKSLIKIENGCIKIHDMIQDMGREIVRQESPEEAGNRTRLWSSEDIVHVLENKTGTDKIRVIIQKYLSEDIIVTWDGKAFKKMKNLNILMLKKAWFSEGPKYLPHNLKVLQWWGYPTSCLPIDFNPTKLVMFDLRDSCLQSLEPLKRMENVSVLNLSRSQFITQVPDLSSIPNLTKLRLDGCENLIEIHDSVGYLEKLKILDVQWCVKLRTFPCCIKLPSLEYLGLQHCSSLEKFPEIQEKMEYITSLDLSDTNLELPISIYNLVRLHALIVHKCNGLKLPSSIAMLPKLTDIHIERCRGGELQLSKLVEGQEELISSSFLRKLFLRKSNISDDFLPKCLTWFVNVKYLYLSANNFTVLPTCIKECHLLEWLYLEDCINLREIRGIPPNIKELLATNCISLSSESKSILMSRELHEAGNKLICVPGSIIPEWLEYHIKGASTSFWCRNKFPAISLCCVIGHVDKPLANFLGAEVIINGEKIQVYNENEYNWNIMNCSLLEDHILILDFSEWMVLQHYGIKQVSLETEWNHQHQVYLLSDHWNHVEVSVYQIVEGAKYRSNLVKEVGIIPRKEEKIMEDIRFTNPHKRSKLLDDSTYIPSSWTSVTARDQDESGEGIQVPDGSLKLRCKRDEQFTNKSELKFEIAKVAYDGKLVDVEGAERFIQLMQRLSHDRVSDLSGRNMLVNVIANTKWHCCTYYSVLIKGLPLLDKWIQDVLEGKFGDEKSNESIKEFLSASLLALKKLPVSPYYVHSCQILNSLEHLREQYTSYEIWKLANDLIGKWNKEFQRHIEGLEKSYGNMYFYGTDLTEIAGERFVINQILQNEDLALQEGSVVIAANNSRTTSVDDLELQVQGYSTDLRGIAGEWFDIDQIFQNEDLELQEGSVVIAANNSCTTSSVDDLELQVQGYSTAFPSSYKSDYSSGLEGSSSSDSEEDLFDRSINHEESQLKQKGKLKEDDYIPFMSNACSSTMDFGVQVTDSSNSHAEAETNDTQFPESRVNIGLVDVCSQKDFAQTNAPFLTSCDIVCWQETETYNSLTWDPMEWEHQVACQKKQPILNDSTERDDGINGMASESSDQGRDPWHFCWCALFSSVLSLCSSSSIAS